MDKVVIHSSTNRRWCRGRSSMTWKWRRLISSCQESMWQCRLTSSRHIRLTGTSTAGETERFVALYFSNKCQAQYHASSTCNFCMQVWECFIWLSAALALCQLCNKLMCSSPKNGKWKLNKPCSIIKLFLNFEANGPCVGSPCPIALCFRCTLCKHWL